MRYVRQEKIYPVCIECCFANSCVFIMQECICERGLPKKIITTNCILSTKNVNSCKLIYYVLKLI